MDTLAHDSYSCGRYASKYNRPFPTRRETGHGFRECVQDNFVGSNGGSLCLGKSKQCPVECRPMDHQDWIMC